jgi:uncharacterized membrane protein YheB (UPF0754 family)
LCVLQELAQAKELQAWDKKVLAKSQQLVQHTCSNTSALTAVSELTRSQREVEEQLLSNKKSLWEDPLDVRKQQVAERDALVQLVNRQAADLDSMKAKIGALRRKGGVVGGL